MFTIAICDDSDIHLEILEEMIKTYLIERKAVAKISTFIDPQGLVDSKTDYDIYFLDMQFPGDMDGVLLGKAIREKHPYARLIYVSADPFRAIDTYELRAFCYLLKPVKTEVLFSLLDEIRSSIRAESFIIKTQMGERRLKLENLMYVNIEGRTLCYHLNDGEVIDGLTLRTSFANATGPLKEKEPCFFIEPSLIVNLEEIQILNRDNITFKNGEVLYIPKTAYEKIKNAWYNYV